MKNIAITSTFLTLAFFVTGCFEPVRRNRPSRGVSYETQYDERRTRDRDHDEDIAEDDGRREDVADTAADTPPPSDASGTGTVPPPPPTAQQPQGPAPYAIKVPGKPGFVTSPYAEGKMVDVRGLPPGTEIECPYTKRPIQVP